GARRHGAAGVAQHGGSRALVRPRHHHEERQHRRRRYAGTAARPLRPRYAGGSLSRRRARARRSPPENVMNSHAATASFSPRRIGALVLRYLYLLRSSWPRLIELIYWP